MLDKLLNTAIKIGSVVTIANAYKKEKDKKKMKEERKKYIKRQLDKYSDEVEEELKNEDEEIKCEIIAERKKIIEEQCEEARFREEEKILKNSNTISSINERMYNSVIIIVCIIFIALFYAYLLYGNTISISFVICVLVIIICIGLLLWKLYEKITYTKYIEQIIVHGEREVVVIAKRFNQSIEKVIDDVSYLIIRGYLVHCYIDKKRNKIYINSKKSSIADISNVTNFIKIRCEGCGAINSFDNDVKHICKYCGRAL